MASPKPPSPPGVDKTLSIDEAKAIMLALYVMRPGLHQLPPDIQPLLVDFAVNSGPFVAIQALQECMGVSVDGVIGTETLAAATAAAAAPGTSLITALVKWRIMMVARIVRRDPMQIPFLGGWLARCLEFL